MIKGLSGATIWSEDLNKQLLPFYRDVLGLPVGIESPAFVLLGKPGTPALALGTHGGRTNARRENHKLCRPKAKYAFHRNESCAREPRVARLSRRRSFG